MIRNVVFDLGRVLVDFDPAAYIRGFGYDEETVQKLLDIVFGRDWFLHDRGDIETIGDLRALLAEKHPALKTEIDAALRGDWVKIHTPKTETAAYMKELKERGFKIFILSNLSAETYAYVSQYDFFRLAEGGVFSFRERACKPEPAIYRALLDRYALIPAETVFIDDVPENLSAAAAFGIRTVLFTEIGVARAETERILSEKEEQ